MVHTLAEICLPIIAAIAVCALPAYDRSVLIHWWVHTQEHPLNPETQVHNQTYQNFLASKLKVH